ncbi:hypothetical protein BDQ17DRAFT_1347456 [Cyathus striatus]|nr:hypothetical protein BDQ17DRAFT_1347456 [Cyathus striatus]
MFCLVCRATNDWVLPILYHSIRFTTTAQVDIFIKAHDVPVDRLASRLLLVRNLYFGRTPITQGDLTYTSPWPVDTIARMLWMCRFIETLTILYLDMEKWHKFEHAIPATLTTLVMGPIHGTFSAEALTHRPRITYFTSCHTPLSHEEFMSTITYPTMRKLRKILPHLKKSSTLESLEIVITGPAIYSDTSYNILQKQIPQVTDDKRISLTQVVTHDWVSIPYAEFQTTRREYVFQAEHLCDLHPETAQGEKTAA